MRSKTYTILSVLCIFVILFLSFTPSATEVIVHKYYKTTFDTKLNYPVKVEYWLTKRMHVCATHVPRPNDFKEDPRLGAKNDLDISYMKSGYDRGHNFPAYDGSCDPVGMNESFYYTNMTPQSPGLNRGAWKNLEEIIRKESETYDSIYVVTGSIQGNSTKTIGGTNCPTVYVPDSCWKVYWVKKTNTKVAYMFPNAKVSIDSLSKYKVDYKKIEQRLGKLF